MRHRQQSKEAAEEHEAAVASLRSDREQSASAEQLESDAALRAQEALLNEALKAAISYRTLSHPLLPYSLTYTGGPKGRARQAGVS